MRAFVVLGLVFSIPSQKTVLEKRLRNDLFCVESDVKPQLINQSLTKILILVIITIYSYVFAATKTNHVHSVISITIIQ